MKKISFTLLMLLVLLVPSIVLGEEEKEINQMVSLPYFDIWKYTDGTWQDTNNDGIPDVKGEKNKTCDLSYSLNDSLLSKYTITKIEVTADVNETGYNAAGGWNGVSWDEFFNHYFKFRAEPIIPNISKMDLAKGTATVHFLFDLAPNSNAIDRKEVHFPGDKEDVLAKATEGWRWYLPVFIKWYGIPKEALPELPDLYVKEIKSTASKVEAGKTYNASVTYGMKAGYDGCVTAKLELTHNNYDVFVIDGQMEDFKAGEEKTFNFTFTGQKGTDSVLEAKIRPISPIGDDKNWSNNSKSLTIPGTSADLLVSFLGCTNIIDSGTSESAEATLRNDSDYDISTIAEWRVNGSVKKTVNMTIPANGTIKTVYTLSIPASTPSGKKYELEIEVNPDQNKPSHESSWSNNIKNTTIESFKDESESSDLGPGRFTE